MLGLVLLGLALGVPAKKGDEDQPVYIEADSVELDEVDQTSIYVGNVQVDQGTMRLLADHVTVHHREDRRPRLVIAIGKPVRFKQDMDGDEPPVKGRALRIEYDLDIDQITLFDDAILIQGPDTFENDRIVYDRLRTQVKAGASASGSERVRIMLTPEKKGEECKGKQDKGCPKPKAANKGKDSNGS